MVAVPALDFVVGAPGTPTANIYTHVGEGNTIGVMTSVTNSGLFNTNIFIKSGQGDVALVMVAVDIRNPAPFLGSNPGNDGIIPPINFAGQFGSGRTYAIQYGAGNVFLKVGSGDADGGWDEYGGQPAPPSASVQYGDEGVSDQIANGMRRVGYGMNDLLANDHINVVMTQVGSFNAAIEINQHSVLDQFEIDPNLIGEIPIVGQSHTNSIFASLGYYGNLQFKAGDGDYYGFAGSLRDIAGLQRLFQENHYQSFNGGTVSDEDQSANDVLDLDADITDDVSHNSFRNDFVNSANSSYNVMMHVGNGDTLMAAVGGNNILVKYGNGGIKSAVVGHNNLILRVGDAAGTQQALHAGDYTLFEGFNFLVGRRNVLVNSGLSNDFIIAVDPSHQPDWNAIQNVVVPFRTQDIQGTFRSTTRRLFNPLAGLTGTSSSSGSGSNVPSIEDPGLPRYSIDDDGSVHSADDSASSPHRPNRTGGSEPSQSDQIAQNYENRVTNAIDQALTSVANTSNVIYAGAGADIIVAYGHGNVILGDEWDSILDFTFASLVNLNTYDQFAFSDFTRGPLAVLNAIGLNVALNAPNEGQLGDLFGIDGAGDGGAPDVDDFDAGQVGENLAGFFSSMVEFRFDLPFAPLQTAAATLLEFGSILAHGEDFADDADARANGDVTSTTRRLWGQDNVDRDIGHTSHGQGLFADVGLVSGASVVHANQSTSSLANGIAGDGVGLFSIFPIVELIHTLVSLGGRDNDTTERIRQYLDDYFGHRNYLQDDGDLAIGAGNFNVMFGGQGDDVLAAFGQDNYVYAGEGHDMVLAVGHDNRLIGDTGNDAILSWGRNNTIWAGDGNDMTLHIGNSSIALGQDGDDVLVGFGNTNFMFGGSGDDFIVVGGQRNVIHGGDGNDFIVAVGLHNTFRMGAGIDTVINLGFASTQFFGSGNDIIFTSGLLGAISGEDDDDVIVGLFEGFQNNHSAGSGNDTLYVGGQENWFWGDGGEDVFFVTTASRKSVIQDLSSEDTIVLDVDLQFDAYGSDIWFDRRRDDAGELTDDLVIYTNWIQHGVGIDVFNENTHQQTITDFDNHSAQRLRGLSDNSGAVGSVSATQSTLNPVDEQYIVLNGGFALDIDGDPSTGDTIGDQFESRVWSYFTPEETGYYQFSVFGDDAVELWFQAPGADAEFELLAADYSPSFGYSQVDNLTGEVLSSGDPRASEAILLEAGTSYFLEGRHKDLTGDHTLSVGVRRTTNLGETLDGFEHAFADIDPERLSLTPYFQAGETMDSMQDNTGSVIVRDWFLGAEHQTDIYLNYDIHEISEAGLATGEAVRVTAQQVNELIQQLNDAGVMRGDAQGTGGFFDTEAGGLDLSAAYAYSQLLAHGTSSTLVTDRAQTVSGVSV